MSIETAETPSVQTKATTPSSGSRGRRRTPADPEPGRSRRAGWAPEEVRQIRRLSLKRLLRQFPAFLATFKDIVRHPFAFPARLDANNGAAFPRALDYAACGVAATFVLLLPLFLLHATEIAKVAYFVRSGTQLAMYGILLHLGLKVVGARTTPWRGTLACYSFFGTTYMLLSTVVASPLLLQTGPQLLFSSAWDLPELRERLSGGLLVYSLALNAFSIAALIVMLSWFSKTHRVSKPRVLGALSLTAVVAAPIQLFVLTPFFNTFFGSIGHILELLL